MLRILQTITSIKVLRGLPKHLNHKYIFDRIPIVCSVRNYSDTSKSDSKKVVVKVQGTDTDPRLRVRLARPSDIPRVLRFVRDHARVWPGQLAPPSNLIVGDFVARTLAQGHSMLAEQPNSIRSGILGLALGASVCPWDAEMLERWARCVRCMRSRRLLKFSAHCLRAPRLHDAYGVRNILQVILIVPPDTPKSPEIVNVLAKNAIKRGKEAGFPLVRFDVSKESQLACGAKTFCFYRGEEKVKYELFNTADALEELKLKKEWFVSYKIINVAQMEDSQGCKISTSRDETSSISSNFVSVYTARIPPETSLTK